MDEDVNVIIICPCCATPKDVKASDDEQHFTCGACYQKWAMCVDADRVDRHALT